VVKRYAVRNRDEKPQSLRRRGAQYIVVDAGTAEPRSRGGQCRVISRPFRQELHRTERRFYTYRDFELIFATVSIRTRVLGDRSHVLEPTAR
jgi:hypothetical protein